MQTVRRRLKIYLALFLIVMAAGTFGFMALEDLSFDKAGKSNFCNIVDHRGRGGLFRRDCKPYRNDTNDNKLKLTCMFI